MDDKWFLVLTLFLVFLAVGTSFSKVRPSVLLQTAGITGVSWNHR